MKPIIVAVLIIVLAACSAEKSDLLAPVSSAQNVSSEIRSNSEGVTKGRKWEYSEEFDKMRNEITKYAILDSSNTVVLASQSIDSVKARLIIGDMEGAPFVVVQVSDGQLYCPDPECGISMRFGNEGVTTFEMKESSVGSSDLHFASFSVHDEIGRNIHLKKHLWIELPFYLDGKKQFEFDIPIYPPFDFPSKKKGPEKVVKATGKR